MKVEFKNRRGNCDICGVYMKTLNEVEVSDKIKFGGCQPCLSELKYEILQNCCDTEEA